MEIKLHSISVKGITEGYKDQDEQGVLGYSGKLNIRPPYQREFIYKDKQRDEVINSVLKDFPLNVMYWALKDSDTYELIDGQQRTVSICKYIHGDFSYNGKYFFNLQSDIKEKFLNYKLMIYICSGEPSEKLEWFRIINIAGERLTDQELRNAIYSGSWVTNAKRYFSKRDCPAFAMGNSYLSGRPIRQEYLEKVIKWVSDNQIDDYMGQHQNWDNAEELWNYFTRVIGWINDTFPNTRKKLMKNVEWGNLFNTYGTNQYDVAELEQKIQTLLKNEDITNQSGIYPYLLTGEEKYLSIRSFSDAMKRTVYEKQKGICPICHKHFKLEEMEGDHIVPWCKGGKTLIENLQMLCKKDNREKSKN